MNCHIIKDLLPLYCDKICGDETAKAVEEHLKACPGCRALLDGMRREEAAPAPALPEAKAQAKVLQGVKRKFSLRRRRSLLVLALAALTAMAVLTAASDVENPIPYREGMVTAKLAVDEAFDIYFHGNHYASFWAFSRPSAQGDAIYFCYTQTLKSSIVPLSADHGHICIGNSLMTDFSTATYQVPDSRSITAIYYLEAGRQDYLRLPQMTDAEFAQAAQNAVPLWTRAGA